MDEPTAALAIKEVGKVLDLINSLKQTGVAVSYTHLTLQTTPYV